MGAPKRKSPAMLDVTRPGLYPAPTSGLAPSSAPERRIERLCLDRGLKMTPRRQVIARVLSEADDHPDVEEVHRRALLVDENICIATVYRTVRLFEERGILQRRDFGNGRARYEPADHGHHYHLIDVENGTVLEFNNAAHDRLIEVIARNLGFQIVSMRLEVFGRRLDTPCRPAPSGNSKQRKKPSAGLPA